MVDGNLIEVNPDVCNGKPVVRGTRVTVASVLGFLSAGDSIEDVLEGFPSLTREAVLACVDYARQLTEHQTAPQKMSA